MVVISNFIKIIIIFFGSHILINMSINIMVEPIGNTDAGIIRSRKAILWGQVDVLAQAVSQFLTASMNWDVIRVPIEAGIEGLLMEMKREHPDVVILCQERTEDDASLPIRLIQEQHCPRVVTVELESNQIQVYSKQNIIVQGASDLLSIIETSNFPDCTHAKEVGSTKNA